MEQTQLARETAKQLVRHYFKNDYGEPFELTDGQADIFLMIYLRRHPRNQVICCTQYGKSDTVSMALIIRAITFKEPWAIVSGQKEKAKIIMSRVIQHIFDHPNFYKKLEIDPSFTLDRIRRERSKDHVNFLGGGSIRVFTAQTTNRQAVETALTGFGSPNIIEEEASLIPNDVQAMILRMLGGHKDNFLLKIGNPFFRNHFYKTSLSPKYKVIDINYKQALQEGRYTEAFIEEMRPEPFFDVLYENKFPKRNEITPDGYRQLIPDDLLESAYIEKQEATELGLLDGTKKLGADFAGGGADSSAYVIRYPMCMELISTNKIKDTMKQVEIVENFISDGIEAHEVFLDYGGLGQGIGDRLHEKELYTNNIMFGESSPDDTKHKYLNYRAYLYYNLLRWLKMGGRIIKDDRWKELLIINYKENTEKKFQIQPKEDLKKHAKKLGFDISSPDISDAAALTFGENSDVLTEDDFGIL